MSDELDYLIGSVRTLLYDNDRLEHLPLTWTHLMKKRIYQLKWAIDILDGKKELPGYLRQACNSGKSLTDTDGNSESGDAGVGDYGS